MKTIQQQDKLQPPANLPNKLIIEGMNTEARRSLHSSPTAQTSVVTSVTAN